MATALLNTSECTSHTECVEGWYCDTDVCRKQQNNGVACGDDDIVCQSMYCVDGICCENSCVDDCMACTGADTGRNDGDCAMVQSGSDPRDECEGALACNGDGACYAIGRGAACGADYECTTGHCVDGVCCGGVCDGVCESCESGSCEPVATGLDDQNECAGQLACNGERGCWEKEQGDVCDGSFECSSGFCVDDYCCESVCDESCKSCGLSGFIGECESVSNAADPGTCDSENQADYCSAGICTCDAGGVCRASGAVACTDNEQCASGSCLDGFCCDSYCTGECLSCNSELTGAAYGACAPIHEGVESSERACTGPQVCDGAGSCWALNNGESCQFDHQCPDGHCADGVCCNSVCDGVCESCVNSSHLGECSAITDRPDPGTCDSENQAEHCDADECVCGVGGECFSDGDAIQCGTDDQCQTGPCVDSYCCNTPCSGTCNSCNFLYTGHGYGICAPIADGFEAANRPCAGPQTCDGTGSCWDTAEGEVCDEGYQCPSGFCTDDVCCDDVCENTCFSCAGPGRLIPADGTCSAIQSPSDPDDECAGNTTCGSPSTGACWDKTIGNSCDGDFECESGYCCGDSCVDGWVSTPTGIGGFHAYNDYLPIGANEFIVGDSGTILKKTGDTWTSMLSDQTENLYAIDSGTVEFMGDSYFVVTAVGQSRAIHTSLNGAAFGSSDADGTYDLHAVLIAGDNTVYIGGVGGKIEEVDLTAGTAVFEETVTSAIIMDLFETGGGKYALAGNYSGSCSGAGILKRSSTPTAKWWAVSGAPSYCWTGGNMGDDGNYYLAGRHTTTGERHVYRYSSSGVWTLFDGVVNAYDVDFAGETLFGVTANGELFRYANGAMWIDVASSQAAAKGVYAKDGCTAFGYGHQSSFWEF